MKITVRVMGPSDRAWVGAFAGRFWGSESIVSRGNLYDLRNHLGFIAVDGGERVGLAVYRVLARECELLAIAAERSGAGRGA